MGHYGPPHQVSAFRTGQQKVSHWEVRRAICFLDHEVTWGTKGP